VLNVGRAVFDASAVRIYRIAAFLASEINFHTSPLGAKPKSFVNIDQLAIEQARLSIWHDTSLGYKRSEFDDSSAMACVLAVCWTLTSSSKKMTRM